MSLPRKMNDWIGRTVRLRRDIETKGGVKFQKGEILLVDGHWRGRLELRDPRTTTQYCAGRRGISHVDRHLVEITES